MEFVDFFYVVFVIYICVYFKIKMENINFEEVSGLELVRKLKLENSLMER